MTLLVTLLTELTIYQSADFRLTRSGTIVSDRSMKLTTLQYGEWNGFVSYTGIGQWAGRDTSEFVIEWLTGLRDARPEDVAEVIRDRGTEWLRKIGRNHHTFILAAFAEGKPQVVIISNFEDCLGRNAAVPGPSLEISTRRLGAHPLVLVNGWKPAVSRQARRRLERLARDVPDDPAQIRGMLARMNDEAAASRAAQGTISSQCSVVSFRADGRGVSDIFGPVDIRGLMGGMAVPSLKKLTEMLGFNPGQVVGSGFFSFAPPIPYAPCQPQTVVPAEFGYTLSEATSKDFGSCRALDVSMVGVVLGDGNPQNAPGDYFLWTRVRGGELQPCGFRARAAGINDAGDVAATARMSDGSERAVRLVGDSPVDLGCYRGRDSGATAINVAGVIVGWVCIDQVNRGQNNYRPAAWSEGKLSVLEDFGCAWGQAVDVNDAGTVLVVGYDSVQRCRAILWDPPGGWTEVSSGTTGVFPVAINSEGMVLGNLNDGQGDSIACVAKPGRQWESLGSPPGFHATGINDAGDIIGRLTHQPWLKLASGEMLSLPYLGHHVCTPLAINNAGVVVGIAQTDHGTHALIWTPQESPTDRIMGRTATCTPGSPQQRDAGHAPVHSIVDPSSA